MSNSPQCAYPAGYLIAKFAQLVNEMPTIVADGVYRYTVKDGKLMYGRYAQDFQEVPHMTDVILTDLHGLTQWRAEGQETPKKYGAFDKVFCIDILLKTTRRIRSATAGTYALEVITSIHYQ